MEYKIQEEGCRSLGWGVGIRGNKQGLSKRIIIENLLGQANILS